MSTLIVRVWTHAGVNSCGACCCSSVFTNHPITHAVLSALQLLVLQTEKNVYIRKHKMTLSHVGEMTMDSHFPAKVVSLHEPTHFL